jgi:hypothetical protein
MAPENIQPGTNPNHKPRAAPNTAIISATDENHHQRRHCENSHAIPKITSQNAIGFNPELAYPHASDPTARTMLNANAMAVT